MHTHAHKDEQGNCSLLNHFERLILDQGQLVYSILRSAALLLLPRHCCHLQKLLLGAPKPHNTPTLCPASPCGASSCGQLAKLPHNSRAWWIISSPRWRRGGNRQFAMLKPNPATQTVAHCGWVICHDRSLAQVKGTAAAQWAPNTHEPQQPQKP